MNKSEAISRHPDFPWLVADDLPGLARCAQQRGWLKEGESMVAVSRAGEGNMNLTLRVRTSQRSVIIKQSRPWVEKYEHIAAPWDRVLTEARFYAAVHDLPAVAQRMPELLHVDAEARVMLLTDLGRAADFTTLYATPSAISAAQAHRLGQYLRALHDGTHDRDLSELHNDALRQLNHEHIFRLPWSADNPVDLNALEPGLSDQARQLRETPRWKGEIQKLGDRYLATGPQLVHGDFFPGSWLDVGGEIFVIDPEFCFPGDAEFDLAVALAHFALARAPRELAESLLAGYHTPAGTPAFTPDRLAGFAAAEVIRRILGVAQLPLTGPPGFRGRLLARATQCLGQADWSALW